MPGKPYITIFWFRRDLRLNDNCALFHALENNDNVLPLFIIDTDMPDNAPNIYGMRTSFIYREITGLKNELEQFGSSLLIKQGKIMEVFKELNAGFYIRNIYCNHDYEPDAKERDNTIRKTFQKRQIPFFSFKDQVIFEKDDILKPNGKPYTVFTYFMHQWKKFITTNPLSEYKISEYRHRFYQTPPLPVPELKELQSPLADISYPPKEININILENYDKTRDFPAVKGTSKLGVHLRFGTISIRQLVKTAKETNEIFLNELIWREFFMMILYHFPEVVNAPFKSKYTFLEWRNNEQEFNAWCRGETGYPMVDAGMKELNETGYMHNRVRMITAGFLCKHLLIDWRWGEQYFAEKLLDYELSSNNGNWQWAAGTGCDAVPYFRIFNPETQQKKYDPQLAYIKRWIPDYNPEKYLPPVVEHQFARERAINTYKKSLGNY